MRISSRRLIVGAAALVSACSPGSNDLRSEDPIIRWGTSFGMCAGYCREELEIDGATIRLTRRSWDPARQPTRIEEQSLSRAAWRQLVARLEAANLNTLQDVYGCPDCADGGAEWVEMESAVARKRVTFDYARGPRQLEALLTELRAFRQSFPPR